MAAPSDAGKQTHNMPFLHLASTGNATCVRVQRRCRILSSENEGEKKKTSRPMDPIVSGRCALPCACSVMQVTQQHEVGSGTCLPPGNRSTYPCERKWSIKGHTAGIYDSFKTLVYPPRARVQFHAGCPLLFRACAQRSIDSGRPCDAVTQKYIEFYFALTQRPLVCVHM